MTSATHATPVASSILPVGRQANSATDDLSPSVAAFYSLAVDDVTLRCGPSREGRECVPALSTLVDNPPRDGIECASISTFVDTWVSAPPRTVITRPEYVAQYNGVGECPF